MNGTSTANRPRRPSRYHKQGSPWLDCLRVLWRRGWAAHRIAQALSGLSAAACRQWAATGFDVDALDGLLETSASPLPWTPRQVRHHATGGRRTGKRRRPDPECRTADPRRRYAAERGWLHALPEYASGEGWVGGVELSRRDVDVLCCLRDDGPLTRPQIADLLQLHGGRRRLYNRRGLPVLPKLRRAGLIEVVGRVGDYWLWAVIPIADI